MTEKQKTPELKVIQAEELLDTAYIPSGADVDRVDNDGILSTGDGRQNIYTTYTTYTPTPDGQEGV